MVPTRIERYIIEDCAGGVALKMRQAMNALGIAAIASTVLCVSWWMGPYGPNHGYFAGAFYWIWSGFFAVIVVLGVLGALRREDDRFLVALREVVALDVDDPPRR